MTDTVGVLLKQKDVTVKLAGAAPAAAVAGEPHVLDDRDKLVLRELEKSVALRLKGGNLFVKRERSSAPTLYPQAVESVPGGSLSGYLDAGGDICFGRCGSSRSTVPHPSEAPLSGSGNVLFSPIQ